MNQQIKPVGLLKSIVFFGIPGILLYLSMYYLVPSIISYGINEALGVLGSMWIITIPLIFVGLLLYKRECDSISFRGYFQFFSFKKIKKSDIKYIVIGILVCIVSEAALEPLGIFFAKSPILAPPQYLSPPFNPLKEFTLPIEVFMGVPLKGNWLFLIVFIPLHLIAMLGEEVIWRGYLLPRQEKKYGNWAWVINGILWAWLMHCCLKWNFISMLPSMLITPFMALKTKNTTVSYLIHVVPNMMVWVIILIGIMGI
ncbi:CPBP family intramembrane glutamic endopeptidase [Acetivibrio cellulolyticus]|uniref:CPBP family intramembrane glutamic endopeptidase n=1 Tax=Acetivibrio cellulolyticus TaxID=35830 RepID=UPI0001E2D4E7|nr:CPBP family intramembrane glutamic endopeptidase [Acetivibrio cellulolyticus]